MGESDEENNFDEAPINCLPRGEDLPDLTARVRVENSAILVGEYYEAVLRTANDGEGDAGDSVSYFAATFDYAGYGGGPSGPIGQQPLQSGVSNDVLLVQGYCTEPGEFRFRAWADNYSNVRETDENNEAPMVSIDCFDTQQADMETAFILAREGNNSYYPQDGVVTVPAGTELAFLERTANNGPGTALSSVTAAQTPQGSFELQKMVMAASYFVDGSFAYTCAGPGDEQFTFTADYYNHVPETNENNTVALTVRCE